MYMIWLYIHLDYFTPKLCAERLDAVMDLFGNLTFQNAKSVLRHPDYMILTVPYDMR